MPHLSFGKLLHDLFFPLLLYGFFSWFMLHRAFTAYQTLRRIRRYGIAVPASVTDFSEQTVPLGHLRQKQYAVTVVCTVPETGEKRHFVLETDSARGKRYANEKQTAVIFLPDEPVPMLPETLHICKRQRLTTLFGGIFCLLFCLFLIFALADLMAGGTLSGFLHDAVFASCFELV